MKPQLLIIEENNAFRFLLSTLLNRKYRHQLHRNAYSAVPALKSNRFDLVIINIENVNTPAFEFLVHLHFSSFHTELPVIVLSNNASDEFRRSCTELGIEAFFLKPFDPLGLLNTISETLTLNKIELAAPAKTV